MSTPPIPPRSGVGLKSQHYNAVLDSIADAPPHWVEVHPQNYMGEGGPPHRWLTAIAEKLPLSMHSVGLSLGSADGVDRDELARFAALVERYRPAHVSDHLSWSGNAHDRYPDLLPIPYTHEALDHFVEQVSITQDALGQPMLIENPSRYLGYAGDEMDEIAFLHALCRRSGCGLLLDVNNIEVSCTNMELDMHGYVEAIDPALVGQIHLAGHASETHDFGALLIDDHGSRVTDATWALYGQFIARAGPRPTLIEWDTDIPEFDVLVEEMTRADQVAEQALVAAATDTLVH